MNLIDRRESNIITKQKYEINTICSKKNKNQIQFMYNFLKKGAKFHKI